MVAGRDRLFVDDGRAVEGGGPTVPSKAHHHLKPVGCPVLETEVRRPKSLIVVESKVDGLIDPMEVEGEQALVVRCVGAPAEIIGLTRSGAIVPEAEGHLEENHRREVGVGDQLHWPEEVEERLVG